MQNFIYKLLDILFPQTDFEDKLGRLSLADFINKSGGVRPREYKNITYLFEYKNPFVRRCVWLLKYKNKRLIAIYYAEILNDYILDIVSEESGFDFAERFVFIPIPISKEHLGQRLNNQCELILKELDVLSDDNFDFNYKDLKKVKNTKSQTKTLNRGEREKNVLGSFDVRDNHALLDKRIILLDDVVTTGSTLKEARKILLEAGAKEVILIAMAH